jgi:biopolymer transport protein ExbD
MAHTMSGDDELVTGINVTPLVDVVLVLLVIFMVTAKLIASQGIPLDLPKAASAGTTQTIFTVSVAPNGDVSANGVPVRNAQELESKAKAALVDNPELRTVIQASVSASHGAVMRVMDELREVGVTKIAFATDPSGNHQPKEQ